MNRKFVVGVSVALLSAATLKSAAAYADSPANSLPVAPGTARAAGASRAPHAAPLEEMVVSAHRLHVPLPTTFAVTQLDQADLQRTLTQSLVAVLRQQPGLDVTDALGDGSQATLSLRGFGGNAGANTLLVVDGQAINPADLSPPDLNSLSLADVERIEILAGSASARYGDQATGGVIALATRAAGTGDSGVALGVDSFNGRRYGLALDTTLAAVGVRVAGNRTRSDGFRDDARFDRDDGSLHLTQAYDGGRVDLHLQRVNQKRLALGALTAAQLRADRRQAGSKLALDTRTDNARFGWQQDYSSVHLELDGYRTKFTSTSPSSSPTFGNSLTSIKRTSTALSPRALIDVANAKVTLGVDLHREDFRFGNDSSFFGTSGNKQQLASGAAYALWYQPLAKDWQLQLGARRAIAHNDASGFAGTQLIAHKFHEANTAWETGLHWQATERVAFNARVANSFRVPKVDEQLSVFTGLNPLTTQSGRSVELNGAYQDVHAHAQLSVYQLTLHHEIDFDPRAGFFGDNINLPSTRRQGATGSFSWMFDERLSAGINGELLNATLRGGNTLPFVPKRTLFAWLNWQAQPWLQTRVETAYTGPRYAIGDYANLRGEQGGFAVVNVGLRTRWRDATLTGRIDNLFNRQYAETASFASFLNALVFQPATGRRYALTFEWKMQ